MRSAHAACRAARTPGLPLEVTFAPTRLNIHEAQAVIARARELGAFRFNTGTTDAHRNCGAPLAESGACANRSIGTSSQRSSREARVLEPSLELCYVPTSIEDGLRATLKEPPATLLVLPNGWVKVAAALPDICADLRRMTLVEAWQAYRRAWRNEAIRAATCRAIDDESHHAAANTWRLLPVAAV